MSNSPTLESFFEVKGWVTTVGKASVMEVKDTPKTRILKLAVNLRSAKDGEQYGPSEYWDVILYRDNASGVLQMFEDRKQVPAPDVNKGDFIMFCGSLDRQDVNKDGKQYKNYLLQYPKIVVLSSNSKSEDSSAKDKPASTAKATGKKVTNKVANLDPVNRDFQYTDDMDSDHDLIPF